MALDDGPDELYLELENVGGFKVEISWGVSRADKLTARVYRRGAAQHRRDVLLFAMSFDLVVAVKVLHFLEAVRARAAHYERGGV